MKAAHDTTTSTLTTMIHLLAENPERFSPARQEDKRHAVAWSPFGGGAHICIGQHFATLQVKAVMHQLLLKYRWSVLPGYTMPYQWVPIAKPRDGLPVQLERLVKSG